MPSHVALHKLSHAVWHASVLSLYPPPSHHSLPCLSIVPTHQKGDICFVVIQTTHQTAHGQLLDLTTAPPGTTDLSKFTVNNYMRIVTFKTAYYSFYLPVACGMLISGITDAKAFQTAKDILLIMGQYFQVRGKV